MARNFKALRRARFELLEERQLLAGDVVLNVVDGKLMLQGDTLDNKIVITSDTEVDSFKVTGVDGTTVHKQGDPTASEVVVTGVHSARVELGEGNDLVAVVGADVGGGLSIDTAAGNDRVRVGTGSGDAELAGIILPADLSVTVRGGLRIDTGAGDDQISVDDALIYGRLAIEAGADNDMVSLGSMAAPTAATAAVAGESAARLRVRGSIYADLDAGNDSLDMEQVAARYIGVLGGSDNNTINARMTNSLALAILGDGGMDAVTLSGIHAYYLGIHTGDGNDSVDVRDSVFAAIAVSLGDGNDMLTTAGLKARYAVLLGGLGEDTFDAVSPNDFMFEVIRGFEIPPDINTPPLFRRLGSQRLPIRIR